MGVMTAIFVGKRMMAGRIYAATVRIEFSPNNTHRVNILRLFEKTKKSIDITQA